MKHPAGVGLHAMEDQMAGKAAPLYRAPALEKGLDILELLARQEDPLTLIGLSERLNRSKSEIFRMVQVLETRGYIARWPGKEGYALTNKLFMLGLSRPPVRSLMEVALPEMRRLTEEASQSCHLVTVRDAEVVILARMESPNPMGLAVRVGYRLPLAEAASGRVLYAYQTPETQAAWRAGLKAGAKVEKELAAAAGRIREQGYEMSESPYVDGVTDLSAPILGADGAAIATLTVPYLASRRSRQKLPAALKLTRAAAEAVTRQLAQEQQQPAPSA